MYHANCVHVEKEDKFRSLPKRNYNLKFSICEPMEGGREDIYSVQLHSSNMPKASWGKQSLRDPYSLGVHS